MGPMSLQQKAYASAGEPVERGERGEPGPPGDGERSFYCVAGVQPGQPRGTGPACPPGWYSSPDEAELQWPGGRGGTAWTPLIWRTVTSFTNCVWGEYSWPEPFARGHLVKTPNITKLPALTTEHFVIACREHGGKGQRLYIRACDKDKINPHWWETTQTLHLAMTCLTRQEAEAVHEAFALNPDWKVCRVTTKLEEED